MDFFFVNIVAPLVVGVAISLFQHWLGKQKQD